MMIIGNRDMYARIVDQEGNRLFPDELLDLCHTELITMSDLVDAHTKLYSEDEYPQFDHACFYGCTHPGHGGVEYR